MTDLTPIELNSSETPPDAAVIWLHGLGASGADFVPIVPELQLPATLGVRFLFPNAPSIPVTVNGGYTMPAWYDILDLSLRRKVDVAQLQASAEGINRLIEREISRGIPGERIVVAGFSQGGAVAYEVALRSPGKLAGLIAMSTYLASDEGLHPASADQAIAISHGNRDSVVPVELGREAKTTLERLGYQPEYREYGMEHEVCREQILDIGRNLCRWLARESL